MGLQVYEPTRRACRRGSANSPSTSRTRVRSETTGPTTGTDELPDLTLLPDALGRVVDVERFRGAPCSRSGRSTASTRAGSTGSFGRASSSSRTSSRTRTCTRSGPIALDSAPLHTATSGPRRGAHRGGAVRPRGSSSVCSTTPIHHLPLLGMLNRVTRPGGTMLFETTVDPRPDALVSAGREREGEVCRRSRRFGSSSRGRGGERSRASPTTARARARRSSLREDRRAARRRRSLGRRDAHRPG